MISLIISSTSWTSAILSLAWTIFSQFYNYPVQSFHDKRFFETAKGTASSQVHDCVYRLILHRIDMWNDHLKHGKSTRNHSSAHCYMSEVKFLWYLMAFRIQKEQNFVSIVLPGLALGLEELNKLVRPPRSALPFISLIFFASAALSVSSCVM